MKKIKLTQGRWAIVDNEDFAWLSQWSWCYTRNGETGYAKRTIDLSSRQQTVYMHVEIMRRHRFWKRGKEVDHENTCGCDNRKVNLRPATRKANGANIGLQSNNTSGVRGVTWRKDCDKWQAQIVVNRKCVYLGSFSDKEEAIKARLKAEVKYFGEFQHDPANVCPLGYTGECPECSQRLKELLS